MTKIVSSVSPRSRQFLFLLFLLLLAPIRWSGLSQGIPDGLQPDEPIVVHRALYFASGDLNPHFFYYPSLSMYTTSLVVGTRFAFLWLTGQIHSTEGARALFAHDPSSIYLTARCGMAIFGLLCSIAVLFLGAPYIGDIAAFLAALVILLTPRLIQQAHYAKPDSLLTLLGLLAFLASCNAYRLKSFAWLVISAALCGFAFSTKYNAAPFLIPLVIVFALLQLEKRDGFWAAMRQGVILTAAFLGMFILGTPFALLDFHTFLTHLVSIKAYTSAGTSPAAASNFFTNAWLIASTMGGAFPWVRFI